MFKADYSEVKHKVELNDIAILEKLKLFFMSEEYDGPKSQDCELYNSVLKSHQAQLVYGQKTKVHKLFVNNKSLATQDSLEIIDKMIASSQSNAQPVLGAHSLHVQTHAGGTGITVIGGITAGGPVHLGDKHKHKHYGALILDKATLDLKEAQAVAQLKASYSTSEYTAIPGIFGEPLKLEGQYINLQILCTDLKNKKPEENKESKESAETKGDEKYKDARMASVEDLFGDKRAIKAEDLFKPIQELFDKQKLEAGEKEDKSPRLLLVQGRAGIGKTTFVHHVAHQWSKGQLYANYTWIFTLTLRKLRLLPDTPEISLLEWVRLSQFSDWNPKEFDALWKERIKPAINQNQVLLILDGHDEVPEKHPCQAILNSLLNSVDIYQNPSLLVTSRPSSAEKITEKRRNLEIIGFTDENINQYIQAYFSKAPDKTLVHTLTETLRKQPVIWANAHIPFNLNLLCGIMEDAIKKTNAQGLNQALIELSSMTRLYQVMERKLYERSHSRYDVGLPKPGVVMRRARTDFIQRYHKERLFLAELAFQGFKAECIIIPGQIVGDMLQAYVESAITQGSQKEIEKARDELSGEFFDEVCKLGLMKPVLDNSSLSQAERDYEFLHLTFQEYYTAIYLAAEFSSQESTSRTFAEKILSKEKYNPRWQIVWWFVAGLLRENTLVYRDYLEQLQGRYKGQMLSQDIFEHYQLGLLTRCIDEGFELHNQQVIEPIVQQLQLDFLKHYRIAKNLASSQDVKNLALIKSPFFSACRINPSFWVSEKRDLYALVPESIHVQEKNFLLEWMKAVQIVTPKMLLMLTQLLVDEDSHIRRSTVEVLGKLGAAAATPKILEMLLGLLADKDWGIRSSAADALDKLGATAATLKIVDTLLELLVHESSDVRCSAANMLGKLGAAAATPKILEMFLGLLADKDCVVRYSVAKALDELGAAAAMPKALDVLLMDTPGKSWHRDKRSIVTLVASKLDAIAAMPRLLEALLDWFPPWEVRNAISCTTRFVNKLGAVAASKVLDALLELLEHEDKHVRSLAVTRLSWLGEIVPTPKIVDALLGLLTDEEPVMCRSVAEALSTLGNLAATPKVLDALLRLIVNENNSNHNRFTYSIFVRQPSVRALGSLLNSTVATPKVLDALTRLLADQDFEVRYSVTQALGKLGTVVTTPQILEALPRLLVDKDSRLRLSAAKTLGRLDIATPKVLDTLLELLANKDGWIGNLAKEALSELGSAAVTPRAMAVLVELLAHEDHRVRRNTAEVLVNLGATATTPQTLEALLGLLMDKESSVRCSVAEALGKLGAAATTPQILGALLGLLMDKESSVRCSVAEALGKLDVDAATPKILDALLVLLADKDSLVLKYAVKALGKLGAAAATPKILDALLVLLADKNSFFVRSSAAEVAGSLGTAAIPGFLNALVRLLADEHYEARHSATKALDKLRGTAATSEFLHLLLDTHSAPDDDEALHIFGVFIETVFTLVPSFCSEHANHPNILSFVSYALAAAYLNSHISCQIDFDKEGVSAGYCVRGVVGKSRYCFLVTEARAQSLVHLSSLVIEQLSKTGRLDIEELKKHLLEREVTVQNSSLNNRGSVVGNAGNVIQLAGNRGNTLEQKGSPMLTQYQQGSGGTFEARINQSYREVKSTCRIC